MLFASHKRWFDLFARFWNRPTSIDQQAESYSLAVEPLEDRLLLSAYPSVYEQYMLELINLARANPAAYAASLGIDLNEGLAANTISTFAKQPLAINVDLTDGARSHSQWMLDTNTFSHYGAGGSNPQQRMQAAGYVFSGAWSWGENIGYQGTTGAMDRVEFTRDVEEALFVDAGIPGRGHRLNLMNDYFAEIGVGIRSGLFTSYRSVMATQDFARSGSWAFLTGVVYDDSIESNRFYNPGEGLGGVTVTAVRDGGGQTYSTSTWPSGGYSLALPKGRYSVMVSGGPLNPSQFMPIVLMGTRNRKFDFIQGAIRSAPEIAVTGNDLPIIHRDSTPRVADNTDFGDVPLFASGLSHSFSIHNIGNANLQLDGVPTVSITGVNADEFTVSLQPPATIGGGSSAIFTVQFNPSGSGTRSAEICIHSNDSNESPFRFTVSGNGVISSSFQSGNSASSFAKAAMRSATVAEKSMFALPTRPISAANRAVSLARPQAIVLSPTNRLDYIDLLNPAKPTNQGDPPASALLRVDSDSTDSDSLEK